MAERDLDDEGYRAIARANSTFVVGKTPFSYFVIEREKVGWCGQFDNHAAAADRCEVLNGRAAVAEYRLRVG